MTTLASILGIGSIDLIFTGLIFALLGFWVWMLVDCATQEKEAGSKIAWLLVIILIGGIGAPIYFFVRKLPRKKNV